MSILSDDKDFKKVKHNKNIKLYLPESFEWIILSSNDCPTIRNGISIK